MADLRYRIFEILGVFREPKDGIYRNTRTTGAPGTLELSRLAGASVDLSALL